MRNLASSFTMRKDRKLPHGDWFTFKADEETPKLYIYDEIGFWGTDAQTLVDQLKEVDSDKLDVHLNSPGGEVFDGIAIYNALKQHKAEVTVYVDGLAASAASFIAQAADTLVMARNAQMMIHDGIALAYGNEQDMLDTAKVLSQISNNIADIYAYSAQKRGFDTTLDEFRALMREEVWYTGKEAVDVGLADQVLDHDDEEAETAKNKWDLSFYNHAGRERAESPFRIAARLQLSNTAKEKDMADGPKNEGGQSPAEETPTESGTPTGDTSEPGTTVVPDDAPTGEPTETTTATQPEATPPSTPENKATAPQGVVINGKLETDWSVINQHFAQQETVMREQREANRRVFVEKLAADNKIAASQINSLLELVNGTDTRPAFTDEQYAAFVASYESAPASSLFDNHATQTETQSQPGPTSVQNRDQRIKDLEGIIAMHERRGMSPEDVKNTKSYIELQSLLGNNS
jgi:ATP-dependent protease ClpP protease subunit